MDLGFGYYNFFNIGAYGNGTSNVITNGLKYAQNKGWNSVEKSVLGGAEFYKSQYIGKGQNTLYYQRFNVVYNASLFSHQYQQDIMGAQTSATLLKNYYTTSSTIGRVNHTFIIPLYENMPKTACARPSTSENSVLNAKDGVVTTDRLAVRATPNGSRVISYLNRNEKIKVLERAKSTASDGNYWDIIVSNTDGTYGYAPRSGFSAQNPFPTYVFDYQYYADSNPELKAVYGYDENQLYEHFVLYGAKEGRTSSPVFNAEYYFQQNPGLREFYGNNHIEACNHFMNYGCKEYRRSSPEFDVIFYKFYNKDLSKMDSFQLIQHYMNSGRKEGRWAYLTPEDESIVFNAKVYDLCNPGLRKAVGNTDQALKEHWLQFGISEGRIASLMYDSQTYKLLNDGFDKLYGNNHYELFRHFILYGLKEGRDASMIFSPTYYLDQNLALKSLYKTDYKKAYLHFKNYGLKEGREASCVFNIIAYMKYNSGLKETFANDYEAICTHFLNYGCKEFRRTSEWYDILFYKYYNKELSKMNSLQLIQHYLKTGRKEGKWTYLTPEDESIVFDAKIYDLCNPGLRKAVGNTDQALKEHWLQFGISEGRIASLMYDSTAYRSLNNGFDKLYGNNFYELFRHFMLYGLKEGRDASVIFSPTKYYEEDPGLKKLYNGDYKKAYLHFKNYGLKEGRTASCVFNVVAYMNLNPGLKEFFANDYEAVCTHFLNYGIKEARRSSTTFDIIFYMNYYEDLRKAYKNNYKEYYMHYIRQGRLEGRKAK